MSGMKVVLIGGTGHIGTYLVPRLVEAGHEVTSVSRQQRQPYQTHPAWNSVRQAVIDREAAERDGSFGRMIRDLEPEAVIDLICFAPGSARQIVEALRGRVRYFLHCGTIWVHGHSVVVPTTEEQPRAPFGEYGIHKAAIEAYLLEEAERSGFPAAVIHPGHIVGPGWNPLNPEGHFNNRVFARLARGEEVVLPNFGLETVHHVHADDVAQAFMQALTHWDSAAGESFHVVSPAALTLRGYAEEMAAWFGQTARLKFAGWEEWRGTVSPEESEATWDHISHSPNCSIEKARRLIDYQPGHSSLQAVQEAVEWQIQNRGLLA
jgi:nucleoside-diphosphate-sugar epimerase